MSLVGSLGWSALLVVVAGEVLVPWALARFYPGYNARTMAISVLGHPGSPVRAVFNAWMLAAGVLLLGAVPTLYAAFAPVSRPLSVALVATLAVFAVGACLCSAFFPANERGDIVTTASRIHGAGSAIGFLLLLLDPLLLCLLHFRMGEHGAGLACAAAFVLALGFFALFVMADKEPLAATAVAQEGLWQRLSLYSMYAPFVLVALRNVV